MGALGRKLREGVLFCSIGFSLKSDLHVTATRGPRAGVAAPVGTRRGTCVTQLTAVSIPQVRAGGSRVCHAALNTTFRLRRMLDVPQGWRQGSCSREVSECGTPPLTPCPRPHTATTTASMSGSRKVNRGQAAPEDVEAWDTFKRRHYQGPPPRYQISFASRALQA